MTASERMQIWRKNNPEKAKKLHRECTARWREKNPIKSKETNKQYHKNAHDKCFDHYG